MTVVNPNNNFPGNNRRKTEDHRFKKYGSAVSSNVKWAYNFDPLKKWAAIILSSAMLVGFAVHARNEYLKVEFEKALQAEAETARRAYLERRLEIIKKETIAAAEKEAEESRAKSQAKETTRAVQKQPGLQVYSRTTETGRIIYSNKQ